MRSPEKRPRSKTFGHIDRSVLDRSSRSGISLGIAASVASLLIIVIGRAFLFQTFKIPSASMTPTLEVGDHIIVNRALYGITIFQSSRKFWQQRLPMRGDVIVFSRFSEFEDHDSNTHYIKRIAAIPGDTVEVKEYRAYVNGQAQGKDDQLFVSSENLLESDVGRNYGPVKLSDDEYFVLGENQANSRDSRFYGPISFADIEGRAEMVYWSWYTYRGDSSVRWERVGKWIR